MLIKDAYQYVAGTHKSDTVDLAQQSSAIRVTVPAANSAVTLSVMLQSSDTAIPLTFLPGHNGWDPISIRRILDTGTSNDDSAGTVILIGTLLQP